VEQDCEQDDATVQARSTTSVAAVPTIVFIAADIPGGVRAPILSSCFRLAKVGASRAVRVSKQDVERFHVAHKLA
jgi:hypothetical protein